MKKHTYFFTLGFLLLGFGICHADTQVITLKDGSNVKGELIGISNGVYTIKTDAMGDVQINAGNVISIAAPGAALPVQQAQAPAAVGEDVNAKMQSMQAELMSNPALMADMTQMISDPEITQLLSDPELMRIVTSKDVNAIQNNPKAQALVNNPKMKALIQKIQGASQ